jgi:two-component system sensor histidine kinase VanS
MKKRGIFGKVFVYTMILATLLVCVTGALFSGQFMSFFRTAQSRQIMASYTPLVERIQRSGHGNISEIAGLFYENNQSFEFFVADKDGEVIFATLNADIDGDFDGDFYYVVHNEADFSIIAQSKTGLDSFYNNLLLRVAIALAALIALCLVCAFVFARKVTEPIISKLEDEVLRERELEEAQRYFFAAASHELKTPLAATGVILEGMLENIGDYKDHSKYLRECVKLTDEQGSLISEILEIVNLIDGKIAPALERVNLSDSIRSVLPACTTLAEAAGQRIIAEIPAETIVSADSNMLKKVLSNVILNAVQNAPGGAEIRIWSEAVSNKHRLFVLNTNTRIDDNILPKLFDPFYRADKARNRKGGHSGFGLTIVQKTLSAMGAEFALENTADGVLFRVDLPKE